MSIQQQGTGAWTEAVESGAATAIRRAVIIDTGTSWQFSDTTAIADANLIPNGTGEYVVTTGATDPAQLRLLSTPTGIIIY